MMSGLSKDFDFPSVASRSQEGQENRRLKVTLLSSEWRSSTDGDLSTINRELAIQLAKHSNVEVSVFLPQCSEEDKNNAASHHVQIVEAEKMIGWNPVDWLINVPDGHVLDCVVGHGISLGRQVQVIRKHHRCKWIQVVHTAPEELGMYKNISQGEQLQKTEVSLCEMADQVVAIGPKLADAYKRYLCCSQKEQNVLDLTPGIVSEFLDLMQATEERRTFSVLVTGSGDCCEDFILKGYDLAAQAIAELKDKSYQLKFVGAPREKRDEIVDQLLQHGIDRNQLIVRSFSDSREVFANLFCEVDLAIMPSKTEGFGLGALKALSAGLPVLVSGNSGLGEALKEVPLGPQCVIDSEDPKDWAREIKAVRQKKRSVRLEETMFLRKKYLEMYSWEEPIRSLVERMYSLLFGSENRPVIAIEDERPASPVLGDDHSGQFTGKLIYYDHHEALKCSSGGQSSRSSMKYASRQCPLHLTQDKLVQEEGHTEKGRPVIASRDKRSASTVFGDRHSKQLGGELLHFDHNEALKGSSGSHSSHSFIESGQSPFPRTSLTQDTPVQPRIYTQAPKGSSVGHLPRSSMDYGQCPLPLATVTQEEHVQQRTHTQDYPEQLVELIRREYKDTVLCPFPWCEEELQFELSKIFTRLMIVAREKERKRLTDDLVKMTEVYRPIKKCDCKWECKCKGETPRVVLIEGQPGMGKTTYCQKLAYDWSVRNITTKSFPKVDMLLRLTCRDMKTANIEDAIEDQLLPLMVDKKDKKKFFDFIRRYQSRILLVFDGLDELPKNVLKEFLPFIKGRVFPLTYVMLTARHEVGMKVRQHCDALFEIVGYTKDDADSYIKKYFVNHEKPGLSKKLIEAIDKDPQLRELTANALNTALLCLVFEDTGGILPYNRTMLYSELVSCVLRRYCSKKGISLDDEDPVEKYTDQLNSLGKQALRALLTDQLAFTLEELKSQSTDFLEFGFLSRQASASKIKLKRTYAFIHKTFQEYFAAFHLAHEVKAADREKAALLAQLSPVDKYWQVWEFLITTAAIKNDDIAVLLVSSLCSQYQKPDKLSKQGKVIDSQQDDDVCRDTIHEWESELAMVEDEVSILRKIIDAIVRCEKPYSKLKPYQVRMADTLARCAPKEKVTVRHGFHHTALDSRNLLVLSEYLKGNRKLKELAWFGKVYPSFATTIVLILQTSHTLTHLRLTNGSCIASLTPALYANHTVTHLNMRKAGVGDVEVKALGKVLQSNHTLTHLCLAVNEITPIGVEALAEALKCNRVLENLNIAMNFTGDKGAVALSQALESNRTLRCLNVSGGVSRIGDQGLRAMAHALRYNSSLTYLNIQGHSFSDPSLTELGKALQSNCSLTHLKLGWMNFSFFPGTRFCDLSAVAFSKALQSRDIQLTRLDLRRTSITSPCVIILAESLRVNGTLERLDLSLNYIDCPGAKALAQALKTNQTLTHLQLRKNKIGDAGAREFVEVLQCNKILIFLGLQDNLITESGGKLSKVLGGRLELGEFIRRQVDQELMSVTCP